jgi:hypothetical protein
MQNRHNVNTEDQSTVRTIEVLKTQQPFTELIVSWNGHRPKTGFWKFSASLYNGEWCEWLPLAEWGSGVQRTFSYDPPDSFAKSYQDVATMKSGDATGYRIRIEALDGATLSALHSVNASFCCPHMIEINPLYDLPTVNLLNVFPRSQQILNHLRSKDLCSPTSTTSAINFLLKNGSIDPVEFAEKAHDKAFDIYGNWILNMAAAYEALDGTHLTSVARLVDFADIHAKLSQNMPVVVSVRGPLKGGARPYEFGHLIFVTGYDRDTRKVHCMDPAFDTDAETVTSYDLDEFLIGWTGRRKNLAYLFELKGTLA